MRHHNPLFIRNRSWILIIHKDKILCKKRHRKNVFDLKKVGLKYIQTVGYNGARTLVQPAAWSAPHAKIVCLVLLAGHHLGTKTSFWANFQATNLHSRSLSAKGQLISRGNIGIGAFKSTKNKTNFLRMSDQAFKMGQK